LNLHSLAHLAD